MHRMIRMAALAAPTALAAATLYQPARTIYAQSAESINAQPTMPSIHPPASQKPLAGGCPMAQRPGAAPIDQSNIPPGHPPIPMTAHHHPHPSAESSSASPHPHHSANPLNKEGGCPMAKHRAEPKSDDKPRLAERTINPAYINQSDKSDEAELPEEGEFTPEGEIPAAGRGNSDDGRNWVNPSANSLYRALKRKEKGIETEDAMSVSMVHNAVTANTWTCIMDYESTLHPECKNPTLARFFGMDGIYTIKARFFNKFFGAPLPFDRHDWIVDRCGTEVRYIIDYYAYEELNGEGELEVSYSIDARPAPTVFGTLDRARMAWHKYRQGEQFW